MMQAMEILNGMFFSLQLLFLTVRNCMNESKIKEIGVGIMDAYVKDSFSEYATYTKQTLASTVET